MQRPLWLISGIWWDSGRMLVPTIDLITVSDIWSTTIQDRLVYHTDHSYAGCQFNCHVCLVSQNRHNAECHNAECRYAEYRGTLCEARVQWYEKFICLTFVVRKYLRKLYQNLKVLRKKFPRQFPTFKQMTNFGVTGLTFYVSYTIFHSKYFFVL